MICDQRVVVCCVSDGVLEKGSAGRIQARQQDPGGAETSSLCPASACISPLLWSLAMPHCTVPKFALRGVKTLITPASMGMSPGDQRKKSANHRNGRESLLCSSGSPVASLAHHSGPAMLSFDHPASHYQAVEDGQRDFSSGSAAASSSEVENDPAVRRVRVLTNSLKSIGGRAQAWIAALKAQGAGASACAQVAFEASKDEFGDVRSPTPPPATRPRLTGPSPAGEPVHSRRPVPVLRRLGGRRQVYCPALRSLAARHRRTHPARARAELPGDPPPPPCTRAPEGSEGITSPPFSPMPHQDNPPPTPTLTSRGHSPGKGSSRRTLPGGPRGLRAPL